MEERRSFYSDLWRLMLPLALQNLMMTLVSATDALVLAGVGGVIDGLSGQADQVAVCLSKIQKILMTEKPDPGFSIRETGLRMQAGFFGEMSFLREIA